MNLRERLADAAYMYAVFVSFVCLPQAGILSK